MTRSAHTFLDRFHLLEVEVRRADELFARTVRLEHDVDLHVQNQPPERREYFLEAVSDFVVDAIRVSSGQRVEASKDSIENLEGFLKDEFSVLVVQTDYIKISVKKGLLHGFEILDAIYITTMLH